MIGDEHNSLLNFTLKLLARDRIRPHAGGVMALADELKTLQNLHQTGKLTDQEYADAKASTLKSNQPDKNRTRRPFLSGPVKALLVLLLVFLGFAWYNVGTRN